MKENKSTVRFFKNIVYVYLGMSFLFSWLFMLPVFHKQPIPYVDALFLSISALSVTGLTAFPVEETLSRWGQLLLMLEMQLGGIGILVLVSYLFVLMGKKMSVTNLWLLKRDQNQSKFRVVGNLGLSIFLLTIGIETIGFALMYPTIATSTGHTGQAIFETAFHSVSSFTNAGFSLYENSLNGFDHALFFVMVTGVLIFMGGLGYPTLMEYLFNFRGRKTLFTKINVRFHFGLLAASSVLFLLIEWNNVLEKMSVPAKWVNAFFLGFTTRSGGLNTVDISLLDSSTVLLMLGLMFIGGASTSTAGGIRLTTFAVVLSKVKAVIIGNERAIIAKRTISEETVNKAFLIFSMFILLFFTSTWLISLFENHQLVAIAFETMSALTNTGLSQGITEELGTVSKGILMILMIIGRVGIFSVIYLIFKFDKKQFKYVDEDLIVG